MAEGEKYEAFFHPDVADDLRRVPSNMRRRIMTAVGQRLSNSPDQYGQRLRQSLHGYWNLRVGDYRVVYEIVGRQIRVYAVMHRREVYADVARRTSRGWVEPPSR